MTKELKQELQKDFRIVGSNSKQGKMIASLRPRYSDLWQCYNSFSRAKEEALKDCYKLESKYNGLKLNGGIYSYCINNFTFTFEFEKDGCKFKAWITKSNNYLVEL